MTWTISFTWWSCAVHRNNWFKSVNPCTNLWISPCIIDLIGFMRTISCITRVYACVLIRVAHASCFKEPFVGFWLAWWFLFMLAYLECLPVVYPSQMTLTGSKQMAPLMLHPLPLLSVARISWFPLAWFPDFSLMPKALGRWLRVRLTRTLPGALFMRIYYGTKMWERVAWILTLFDIYLELMLVNIIDAI